jgi:hypothetical protein
MLDKLLTDSGSRSLRRVDILFFCATFVYLYTQLFQFPFTPYNLEGDTLISVSDAMRIIDGEVMYRDFFHLTPPGAEVWYAALFSIFGVRLWILNFTILLLNLSLTWFVWRFSRQLLSGVLVYVAPALFLVVGLRLFFLDGSYRLFSVVFALAAVAVVMGRREPRDLLFAGVFCGLSSFFLQPRGVLTLGGIAVFLVWEHVRRGARELSLVSKGALLVLPFIATIIATNAYFIWSAGFDNYYFSVVTFVQKYYRNDPLSNSEAFMADLPDIGQYSEIYSASTAISRYIRIAAPTLFFYGLVPYVYLAFLIYRWRKKTYLESDGQDRKLVLLCIFGLALLVGVSAPSVFRLAHMALPGLVVLVWLIGRLKRSEIVASSILCVLILVGIAYVIQRQTIEKNYLEMPAGRAAFLANITFQRFKWVGEHTRPGDLFWEGHHLTFYFAFHLKNPTPLYLVRDNGYTPKFQADSVLAALERNPPEYIVWPRKWEKTAEERLPDDNLDGIWRFVLANYEFQMVFEKPLEYTPNSEGDLEIWRRKLRVPAF